VKNGVLDLIEQFDLDLIEIHKRIPAQVTGAEDARPQLLTSKTLSTPTAPSD
jgi:hypothetical protein